MFCENPSFIMSSSLNNTSYDVEVTLPDRTKKIISVSKSITKSNNSKPNTDYDATINQISLSLHPWSG